MNGQPIFDAVHHYCSGLMKTNRAVLLARTKQIRMFYLGDSIKEFDYVLKYATRDFVLLPEILTKKGENLLRLGRAAPAFQALEQAIEIKPDYWPPYAYMSDHYKAVGDLKKARELLDRGLSASPDANALKARLAELRAAKANRKTEPPATEPPVAPKPPASK